MTQLGAILKNSQSIITNSVGFGGSLVKFGSSAEIAVTNKFLKYFSDDN
jgi:hypothetical protein